MSRFLGLVPLLTLLALATCRSADPAYYTLAPIRGAARGGAPKLIELRRPGVAGYLDRSEIVRSNSAYQLSLNAGERWGEPFSDMVGRVLAEDLNTRLPGTSVFTSTGAISAETGARVELDVQRFDLDPGGQVVLLAQVAVSRSNNRSNPVAQPIRETVTPAGPASSDYVAAMSVALARAADQIAALLRRVR